MGEISAAGNSPAPSRHFGSARGRGTCHTALDGRDGYSQLCSTAARRAKTRWLPPRLPGFLPANISFYLSDSERQHLATIGRPRIAEQPAGTYATQILNRLLIDLAWNSSRLEGNTYSLLDTKRLIDLGEEAGRPRAPRSADDPQS